MQELRGGAGFLSCILYFYTLELGDFVSALGGTVGAYRMYWRHRTVIVLYLRTLCREGRRASGREKNYLILIIIFSLSIILKLINVFRDSFKSRDPII